MSEVKEKIIVIEGKPVNTDYEKIVEKEDFPPYWKLSLFDNHIRFESFSKQHYEPSDSNIRKFGFVDNKTIWKKEEVAQIQMNYYNGEKEADYLSILIEHRFLKDAIKLPYKINDKLTIQIESDFKTLRNWWLG